MPSSVRRTLAAVAAVCTLGLLTVVPSSSASATTPRPPAVPAANVIVIPGPDQVSNTVDASGCPWMNAYVSALRSASGSRSIAVLLAAPLIAAEYGGMADDLAQR